MAATLLGVERTAPPGPNVKEFLPPGVSYLAVTSQAPGRNSGFVRIRTTHTAVPPFGGSVRVESNNLSEFFADHEQFAAFVAVEHLPGLCRVRPLEQRMDRIGQFGRSFSENRERRGVGYDEYFVGVHAVIIPCPSQGSRTILT